MFELRASSADLTSKARMMVVDPFKKIPLHDADFDEIIPLGEGTQGIVYAVAVHFEGDPQEYRYVVKRLRRTRVLPPPPMCNASFSCSEPPTLSAESSFVPEVRSIASASTRRRRTFFNGPSFDKHAQITEDNTSLTENNIIKLIQIIKHNNEEYALLPYCELFLDMFMEGEMNQLDYEDRMALTCEILIDVLNAVRYLNYSKDFVHRDLKPENIALCEGKWCILDFECAAQIGQKVRVVGSPYYMHPWCFLDPSKSALPGNDMYAVGQIMKQLLLLPPSFQSTCYYDIMHEKVALYKAEIKEKWEKRITIPPTDETSVINKLIRLSEEMCGLMSDQPDIDNVIERLRRIHEEICAHLGHKVTRSPLSSEPSSLFSELYKSSKSDGYFSSSQDKAREHMREIPRVLERRRSSWGGILAEEASKSDDSDFGEMGVSVTNHYQDEVSSEGGRPCREQTNINVED